MCVGVIYILRSEVSFIGVYFKHKIIEKGWDVEIRYCKIKCGAQTQTVCFQASTDVHKEQHCVFLLLLCVCLHCHVICQLTRWQVSETGLISRIHLVKRK